MSASSDHVPATFSLLRRYLRGEVPLQDIVAALRALPLPPPGDVPFGIDDADMTPEARGRLEALGRALGRALGDAEGAG